MRRTFVAAVCAGLLFSVVGCGQDTVNRAKLEEAIEKRLSKADEGYSATCPDDVSWSNPKEETFPIQLTDSQGNKYLVRGRVLEEGDRTLYGDAGVFIDGLTRVPQTSSGGESVGAFGIRRSELE